MHVDTTWQPTADFTESTVTTATVHLAAAVAPEIYPAHNVSEVYEESAVVQALSTQVLVVANHTHGPEPSPLENKQLVELL